MLWYWDFLSDLLSSIFEISRNLEPSIKVILRLINNISEFFSHELSHSVTSVRHAVKLVSFFSLYRGFNEVIRFSEILRSLRFTQFSPIISTLSSVIWLQVSLKHCMCGIAARHSTPLFDKWVSLIKTVSIWWYSGIFVSNDARILISSSL